MIEKETLAAAYAAEAELEQKLSRRELRRLGLTVLNVRRRARQMAIAGEITMDMSQEQIRDTIMDDLQGDEPRAYEQVTAPDWNAILAFLEKLLPLILQIIAMFG